MKTSIKTIDFSNEKSLKFLKDNFNIAENAEKKTQPEQELMVLKNKRNFSILLKLLSDFIPQQTLKNLKYFFIKC